MADLMVQKNFLVDAKPEAEKKWLQSMLQEKKSIVVHLRQDIENLLKGKIPDLEGNLIMFEAEVKHIEAQIKKLDGN